MTRPNPFPWHDVIVHLPAAPVAPGSAPDPVVVPAPWEFGHQLSLSVLHQQLVGPSARKQHQSDYMFQATCINNELFSDFQRMPYPKKPFWEMSTCTWCL